MVEALVAMLCIGLVLVAAFSTVIQGRNMVDSARDLTRAGQILQSQMEDVRMLSWSDLESIETATSGNWVTVPLSAAFINMFGNKYAVERRVFTRTTDQKEIQVRVNWTAQNGQARSEMTAAWFTKGGLHDYLYRSF